MTWRAVYDHFVLLRALELSTRELLIRSTRLQMSRRNSISGFMSTARTARPQRSTRTKTDLFRGLERADSVSLDPHKWLYVPVDAGCLLFRDDEAFAKHSVVRTPTT